MPTRVVLLNEKIWHNNLSVGLGKSIDTSRTTRIKQSIKSIECIKVSVSDYIWGYTFHKEFLTTWHSIIVGSQTTSLLLSSSVPVIVLCFSWLLLLLFSVLFYSESHVSTPPHLFFADLRVLGGFHFTTLFVPLSLLRCFLPSIICLFRNSLRFGVLRRLSSLLCTYS